MDINTFIVVTYPADIMAKPFVFENVSVALAPSVGKLFALFGGRVVVVSLKARPAGTSNSSQVTLTINKRQ